MVQLADDFIFLRVTYVTAVTKSTLARLRVLIAFLARLCLMYYWNHTCVEMKIAFERIISN